MNIRISPWFSTRRLGMYTKVEAKKIKMGSISQWNRLNLDRWESEIFNSCIVLKNMAIVQKNVPLSTDYILEELKENSKYLKNVYGQIISGWRNGQGEEAFDVLKEKVPTRAGKNFTHILCKLDKINPAELVTAMVSFEETFSGERVTKAMKKTERKSVVTTMFATAAIFAILMNFAVVVVFLDTLTMLGQVF